MPLRPADRAVRGLAMALALLAAPVSAPVSALAQDTVTEPFGETGEDSWRCDADVAGNGTTLAGHWVVSRHASQFTGAQWHSDMPVLIDDYRTQSPMALSAYWLLERTDFAGGTLMLQWKADKRLPRRMQIYVDGWGHDGTFSAQMGRQEEPENAYGALSLGSLMRWAGERDRLRLGIYGQRGDETDYLGGGVLPATVLHQMRTDLATLVAQLETKAADFTRQCTRIPYDPSMEAIIVN